MSYTPVPNEVYHIGLSAGAIAVYGYLLHIENRQTFKCYASYKTIGKAVKMSANTVRKYVEELETRHLIRTEQTSVVTKDGRKRNGTLLYNIRPIREAVNQYNERQLLKLEAEAQRQRIQEQLSRRYTPHMCPRDNCHSQNEFIEKAIRFYAGYVSGQEAVAYLPPALASVLRGTVQDTENRICRLLFKQSVELDMVMNVLAAGMEIPEEQLESQRGRCVQNVKKTSGSVTLDAAVRYQRGGD